MKLASALPACLLLCACVATPEHQASGIETPGIWSRITGAFTAEDAPLAADDAAGVEQRWWMHFHDDTLNCLIEEALANNKTLGIAKARVEEARAGRTLAVAQLLPQVDGLGTASRQKLVFLNSKTIFNSSEADAQATWELDIFGKNQARLRQAKALLQAEKANAHGVMVGLLAEVARNYFEMRNAERQIDILQKNLGNQRKTLELTNAQFQGALLSNFDVQRAEAQVSATEAQLPLLQAAYDAARNRLSVLVGQAPGSRDALLATPQELQKLDAQIVVAAPARVLAERPDVQAAERQFAASKEATQAAIRQLFPDISLTALYGIQSSSFLTAQPWSLAANLTQPLLSFGLLQSQIDAADARQQQAFLNYQETVLEALEDMENALSAYVHEFARNALLRSNVEQNRKAAELAHTQFTSGYAPLLDVLVADQNVLAAESNLAASDTALRENLVRVYAAAGGGWKVE